MLGQTQFMGSKFCIFGVFEWVQFFWMWAWVRSISGQTGSRFGLFGGFRKGLKFGFSGWTWIRVSLKFDLSSLKKFEVRYIWVWSNIKFLNLFKKFSPKIELRITTGSSLTLTGGALYLSINFELDFQPNRWDFGLEKKIPLELSK